jgi:hypothetical protein
VLHEAAHLHVREAAATKMSGKDVAQLGSLQHRHMPVTGFIAIVVVTVPCLALGVILGLER